MNFTHRTDGWRNWTLRHDRLRSVGLGLLIVAAAVAVKFVVNDWGVAAASYVLFGSAVAVATWFGGWPAGAVAALTALLLPPLLTRPLASLGATITGSTSLLFIAEAVFLVAVVARIQRERAEATRRFLDADTEIVRLRGREQDLLLVEQAFEAAAVNVHDSACLVVDVQGRVVRWNPGAEKLYGYKERSVAGQAWPALGAPENSADSELRQLFEAPIRSASGVGWMRRADGGRFQGEVAVTPMRDTAGSHQGFIVVIRDLSATNAAEEFRVQSLAAHEALQGEVDALTDQLEAIQVVLDPELSELAPPALVKELMGRLLTALPADGAAFVDTRHDTNAVVYTAPRGLQAQSRRGRRPAPRGLRIIQNDVVRAREASVVTWPETVGLLVTVPVTSQKLPMGSVEVVTRRARRWTERDALVLLLAADRVAAVLSGAPARETADSPATVDQIRLSLPQ